MVHCGYDPSGALGTCYESGDNWKNFKYNFGSRPAIDKSGLKVKVHNGYSIGKGHLADANAAIRPNTEDSLDEGKTTKKVTQENV